MRLCLATALGLCALLGASAPLRAQVSPLMPAAIERGAHGALPLQHRPWAPRRRTGVQVEADELLDLPGALSPRRLLALGLRGSPRAQVHVERWPQEPEQPGVVLRGAFEAALLALCPDDVAAEKVRDAASATLAAAAEFGVDPFLLGALLRHQSGCRPRSVDAWGVGLTRVNLGMYRGALHHGQLHYGRPHGDDFEHAQVPVPGLSPSRKTLLRPVDNLRFAAAALRMFGEQCGAIDPLFGSVSHRHPVSHLVWGDRVRSALPEAQILTERRRLLEYYGQRTAAARPSTDRPSPQARVRDLRLSSPLDGAPRLVIGLLGDPRDGGERIHYGIDLPAAVGEPVRAVADGTVTFAGVELRRRGEVSVAPERLAQVRPGRLGKRGVFVRVEHADGLRSMYVHLADYRVKTGQTVRRGDVLGTIGLQGIHTSDAHLHFGLFDGDIPLDPMRHLSPYLLTNPVPLVLPEATRATLARRAARAHRRSRGRRPPRSLRARSARRRRL